MDNSDRSSTSNSNTSANTSVDESGREGNQASVFAPRYTLLDHLIMNLDEALKSSLPGRATPTAERRPQPQIPPAPLTKQEERHAAGLMRVNHTGEVCAQALYRGQALTASLEGIRDHMEAAAQEEEDHLAWCDQRLSELNSHPSRLNPLFYGMSFALGALAGFVGDEWSLGFVAETEHQVCKHLDKHLEMLPSNDTESKAVLRQMREDEKRHEDNALAAGGRSLPEPIKLAMKMMSIMMTNTTRYV